MCRNGKMFKEWKKQQTIFIDREKIRPITLASCALKIMERMVNNRLIWIAEKEKWLDKIQNGFRGGKSCLDNLSRLKVHILIL